MILSQRKAAQVANEIYRRVEEGLVTRYEAEKALRLIMNCMSDAQLYKALDFFAYNRMIGAR